MPARQGGVPPVPKLNLLPPHIAAARRMTAVTVATVVVVVLVLAGMGVWWRSNAATIARLEQDLQEKTRLADEVRRIQQEAQTYKAGVQTLTDRLAVLDDIRQSGRQLAQLLRDISAWIPRGVRLTALYLQGGPAGPAPTAPVGMPGAPAMSVGPEAAPEAAGMPTSPAPVGTTPAGGGGTQVSQVTLHGYTTSLYRLAQFYTHLSQSDLFSSVQLVAFEWRGRVYSGTNLQPLLRRQQAGAKPLAPETPSGQPPAGAPGAPAGAPSAPAPEAVGGPGMGGPGMGAHGGGGAPLSAPGAPPMGAPGMGAHGGGAPSAPPVMMGPMAPGMAPGVGGTPSAQFVRDPTAPRNAVYFVIQATLARPVQIAAKLHPQPAPGAGAPGMPGAPMMAPGAMAPGAMAPGALGPAAPPGGPGAPSGPGAAPSAGGGEETAPRGLGRRGAQLGEE